ncbi:MAG TPA: RNHCP domain-containing protein [Candidatus Peregrinibacteria bacterium]|nr:RNHCP domain-containing protein [Candidatus Peregrinibacteria bacterium]
MRKEFQQINQGFTCKNCGQENPPAPKSCRNHCIHCLYSLHVDEETPGDRLSDCKGLMKPISLDQSGKKGYIITHQCEACGKIIRNKVAPDDSQKALIQLSLP